MKRTLRYFRTKTKRASLQIREAFQSSESTSETNRPKQAISIPAITFLYITSNRESLSQLLQAQAVFYIFVPFWRNWCFFFTCNFSNHHFTLMSLMHLHLLCWNFNLAETVFFLNSHSEQRGERWEDGSKCFLLLPITEAASSFIFLNVNPKNDQYKHKLSHHTNQVLSC